MYRIPAIEAAPDGSLLAFAEARKYGGSDPGMGKQDIDLVLKRSTDAGRTWSPMKLIEDPGQLWSAAIPPPWSTGNQTRVAPLSSQQT